MRRDFYTAAGFLLGLAAISFSACASAPAGGNSSASTLARGQGINDSYTAAMDAAMEGKGRPAAGSGGAASSVSGQAAASSSALTTGGAQPGWVTDPYTVFPRSQYVAVTGIGISRDVAEKNALAGLVSYFGQSVQTDLKLKETLEEVTKNGRSSVLAGTSLESITTTSAALDTLVGAEIREAWLDSKTKNYYAVVVMDKAKAAQIYNRMVNDNLAAINALINMSSAEKNSLEGYSRYQFAAVVADVNANFVNVVDLLGGNAPAGLKRGSDYRIEAANIARTIPVGVVVKNDRSGKVQAAFTKAITDTGFRGGAANSRYVVTVDITVSPAVFPNNPNQFARYELVANLTDTGNGTVLMPYSINGREGHVTQSEAENRAYTAAERRIGEEYKEVLQRSLSALLPK